jgi:GDP-L-fucose synthase
MLFDLTDKLVWVAGQHGMVGGAMMRRLEREPCALLRDPGRAAVDLRRQFEVEDWMASHRPRIVFLTAGRVGGFQRDEVRWERIAHEPIATSTRVPPATARRLLGSGAGFARRARWPLGPARPDGRALEWKVRLRSGHLRPWSQLRNRSFSIGREFT